MTTPTNDEHDREARLNAVLLECLESAHAGWTTDRSELLARHPEFAGELKEFFTLRDQINRLAAPIREAALSVTGDVPAAPASPPNPEPLPTAATEELGQIGEFRLLREIGRGGMGTVYEAHQKSLNRRVALKVLPFAAALDAKQLQRFQNEAQAAAQLHHTNIVPVFAVGAERGVHYYAMQLIDGQSLAALIEELRQRERLPASEGPNTSGLTASPRKQDLRGDDPTGPYAPAPLAPEARLVETAGPHAAAISTDRSTRRSEYFRRVAQLGLKAAEALEHAHQAGVVHRDIKPANLLIDTRGNLWITDFGLAQFQTGAGLTVTGELLGTLRYMSPEQVWAKRGDIDHRTDVYSLGVTLYELLTLRPAFEGQDRHELLYRIAHDEPREPRRIDKSIPVELETIVIKAMAKRPAERYDTAQDLADDLQRFLEDKPILAKRPTLVERTVKWARRHRSIVVSAAALMVVITIGSVASTILIAREHAKATVAYEREKKKVAEAEASFQQARQAVDFFVQISTEDLDWRPELQPIRQKLLKAALEYYERFIDEHGDDPELQADLMKAYEKVYRLLRDLNDVPGAIMFSGKTRAKLVNIHPGDPRFQHVQALAEGNQCFFVQGGGQVLLLTRPDVTQELNLAPEQRKKVAELVKGLEKQRDQFFAKAPNTSREQVRNHVENAVSAMQNSTAQILKPDQVKRLKQIDWQMLGPSAFGNPEVARALHLTDEQREQVQRIQDEECAHPPPPPPLVGLPPPSRAEGPRRADRPPGGPDKDFRGGARLRQECVIKIIAILTDEQKHLWKELIGPDFQGAIHHGPPPGLPGVQPKR